MWGSWRPWERRSGVREIAAVGALAAVLVAVPVPAVAATDTSAEAFVASEVRIEPESVVEIRGRRYPGVIEITGRDTGLAVVEETTVDDYLLGIREVPFSWEEEALAAQAVAARTYLAWTLERGRSANGRRYGYDICATSACQVYAGIGGVEGPYGDRWRAAVERTAGEILLYGGKPAMAVYSSTSGGRTRAAADVFGTAVPYLQAVDSPGESSPFVTWRFELDADQMAALLTEADLLHGELRTVRTRVTPDGEGPWMVEIVSDAETTEIGTWKLRGRLNRAAARVLPDVLPARRPDGRRYPQTVMSPSYTISTETRYRWVEGTERFEPFSVFVFEGRGWGHLVGMSQYGAQAMAVRGADYPQILAHYYGGLMPTRGRLPATVRVGLAIGEDEVDVVPAGPVRVVVDGAELVADELGPWTFRADPAGILVVPPPGLGLPPDLSGGNVVVGPSGPETVRVHLRAGAETSVRVVTASRMVSLSGWEVTAPGIVEISWDRILRATGPVSGPVLVEVRSRSPRGTDLEAVVVVPGGE